jgi:hypothetical protein
MKTLLLFLSLMTVNLQAKYVDKSLSQKIARSWIDFGKQVIIDGTITWAGYSFYKALEKHYFRNSAALPLLGIVLFIGGWNLSNDLKVMTHVLPENYSRWASLWGVILGLCSHGSIHGCPCREFTFMRRC